MGELVTHDEVVAFLQDCLTKGVEVPCPNCQTVVHRYDEDRFFKALDRALDRWMGRAVQRQELTGAEGGPIETVETSPRERLHRELDRIATRTPAE